jgi:hypothetical protein
VVKRAVEARANDLSKDDGGGGGVILMDDNEYHRRQCDVGKENGRAF